MRIIHQRMQRIGRECRGVVAVELGERAHEVGGARVARRIGVGLEFLAPRDEARERLEREGEDRHREREPRERRADVRRRELERLVERGLLVHPPENSEEEEREAEAHREEPWNVAAREMAEL